MARVTRDMHLAVREFRIDLLNHLDHAASDFFLRVFVAGEVLHVAVIALHAESRRERAHDLLRLLARRHLQDFQIGGRSSAGFRRRFFLVLSLEGK